MSRDAEGQESEGGGRDETGGSRSGEGLPGHKRGTGVGQCLSSCMLSLKSHSDAFLANRNCDCHPGCYSVAFSVRNALGWVSEPRHPFVAQSITLDDPGDTKHQTQAGASRVEASIALLATLKTQS